MNVGYLARSAAVGIVGALVLVAIVFFIADAVSGPLMVTAVGADAPEELPLGGALFATVIGGLAGIVIAAVASRFDRGPTIFLIVCVVGLVLYGFLPFGATDDNSTAWWLNAMHIAAAVPIVGSLYRWLAGMPEPTLRR